MIPPHISFPAYCKEDGFKYKKSRLLVEGSGDGGIEPGGFAQFPGSFVHQIFWTCFLKPVSIFMSVK